MERRTSPPLSRIDRPVLAAIGIVLAGAMAFVVWTARHREYRHYQQTFRTMVAEKSGPDRASAVPSGLRQIWVPGLRRADRCVTCHQAVAWRGFETAEEPYRTHLAELLRAHPPERYDYSHLSVRKTAFAWHVAHLEDPRALVRDSVMPNFHLSRKEAQAVSMLLLSWRKAPFDAAFLPAVLRSDPPDAAEKIAEKEMDAGPGAWFVQTGCLVCHSIAALKVKSRAQIGPDLSPAFEDTQKRFSLAVDQFLKNPTGTMSAVLSRQIVLTPAQKDVATRKLREVFTEYQRLVANGKDPLALPAVRVPK